MTGTVRIMGFWSLNKFSAYITVTNCVKMYLHIYISSAKAFGLSFVFLKKQARLNSFKQFKN